MREQLALRPRHAREDADQLEMDRPDHVITPTSGSAIRASSSICPKPRMPISSTSTSVPSGAASTASGSPISVLKFAGFASHAAVRRDQRGDQLLGRRLADRAGDADHGGAQLAPPGAREPLQRGQRVAGGRAPRRRTGRVGVLGRDEHAPGAGGERVGREPPAVDVLAEQADEEVARLDARACRSDRAPARPAAGHEIGRRRGSDAGGVPGDHARDPAPAAIASRATSRSSNGSLRPSANSCPCSCPLPAITTTSPGRGQRDRAEDRRAPVGVALDGRVRPPGCRPDLVDDRLGRLRARVVGRDQRDVGEPRGDLAHQRALAAIAVPAGAEHDDHPPGGELASRGQHLLQRIRLVRVVDDDGERLPGVDRLEAARRPWPPAQRRGQPGRGPERARPRPTRPAR